MQIKQKNKLIARYVLGLAGKKEIEQFYSMPESRQMLKEQWDSLDEAQSLPETRDRVQAKVYQKTIHQPRIYRYMPLLRIAAVFLLGLIIGGIMLQMGIFSLGSTKMIAVASPAGQRTVVQLPDGSKVVLAGWSRIEYPENFAKNHRSVHLSGMAYFEVVHRDDMPFTVAGADIEVSVLGTRFSMASWPGEAITETVLLSGKVKVNCLEKNKSVILKPNEQHVYNSISKTGEINPVDAKQMLSWAEGRLIFYQEDIITVCKKLERWYGVDIVIHNANSQQSLYTVTIDNNSLDEMLKLMQKVSPMQYSYNNGIINITFTK